MRILGAILAGGASRRFGSDKALAPIEGLAMLDRVAGRLGQQTDALVVIGRDWPGLARVDDLPAPGFGPLSGLAGALDHAARHGFDAVLSSSCDLPDLPFDLVERLGAPNAVLRGQPTIGLWDNALAPHLLEWLARTEERSVRSWATATGARWVDAPDMANINTPADLARFVA